ncbi:MAG: hypothetical protein ACOYJ1_10190 [Peptococcales bacterium]|jgi:hypothetical protein
MNNWNYEALGFRSEKEMNESIERVKQQMEHPKSELEIRQQNRKNFEKLNKHGGIDFEALNEGARLQELDKVVRNKLHFEKQEAKLAKEQEELNKLMTAAGKTIAKDNEAAAKAEFEKSKAKQEAELEKQIYSKHGAKTEKQIEEEAAYKSLLDSLKL